jgi:Acyl-CoA dehydrogenase, C-terminal domain
MDQETKELLRSSLEQLLAESDERPLSERLVDFGWDETPAEDLGEASRILFELRGKLLSVDDLLSSTLTASLAEGIGDESLRSATLLLPKSLSADDFAATVAGGEIQVNGVAIAPIGNGSLLLPVESGLAFVKDSSSLRQVPIEGFDADLGWLSVGGTLAAADVTIHGGEQAQAAWENAVALGRWRVSAELVGAGNYVLRDVVSYTQTRKQYGVAIGSFQALQHRLASAHAALVGALHMVDEAAATGQAWEALVAKALAGRAVEDACTQAQQCYGAIGFTWEQEFHRYLRRTYALDRLLGDYRSLEFEIGATLQSSREVPRIGEF